ncbi:RNA polymerase subunit sigma [Clostridium estertheticum]|uniref:RNA polymerase subunit sigma n=1 Tax=Clostridium estertheticum TaxID=238834 RepID=UPI001CF3FE24|nr:RNA polymerase subunit sigma [Clostridium estertheticum]MCB2308992.1 RNA polymerase subunit sigma [Clostridium estertheticum]MCB2346874.1 RNA polymerase subunit sigma [Clostridium estertheticum]MCB2351814.1 RNA polymerase subunit sigma [Clostridium estertheticum]WAG48418.1 RNA polymerase subunit sigma [Clostridium estertheticum]
MNLYKKTETLLYNYKMIKAEIKNIDLELIELQNEYNGCGAMTFEEKAAPTNKFNSSVENEMIVRIYTPEMLDNKKHKLEVKIQKIDNALEVLDPRSYSIVTMTYFDNLNYRDISIKLDLTEDYIGDLKREIIGKISGLIYF